MCEVFSGHIVIDKEHKDFGKVLYLSGIHHEKDREELLKKYGSKVRLAAWETKTYATFADGVELTHTQGDITETERVEYIKLIKAWAKKQDEVELFLGLFSITQDGKPLARDKFSVDLKGRVVSTKEDRVTIDAGEIKYFTWISGNHSTQTAGDNSTIIAGHDSIIKAGSDCAIRRTDICEVFIAPAGKKIQTNAYRVTGYKLKK